MCKAADQRTSVIMAAPAKRKPLASFKFAFGDLDVRPKIPNTKNSGPNVEQVGRRTASRLRRDSGIMRSVRFCECGVESCEAVATKFCSPILFHETVSISPCTT